MTAEGLAITIQDFERPTIKYIKFIGNEEISDETLLKKSGLKVGDALDLYAVDEAVRKVESYYRTSGYISASVVVTEGNQPLHRGVVFLVNEGNQTSILRTNFVGNTIVNGARLSTQIKSVPGTLYIFEGKLDETTLNEDIDKLTAYYRNLGYFRARIGREIEYTSSGRWVTITFVIDEGPRYQVRNVSIVGNKIFPTEQLMAKLGLQTGMFFGQDLMDKDVNKLKDHYGGVGYVFADIKCEPRFGVEPGVLDLVFDIREGDQYRVGNINVKITGDNPHTQRMVALNRLGLRPGDIIDIRELRASERRLRAAQLFLDQPQQGTSPRIVVRPPELKEDDVKRY
jgi:outer membrane protein insertion porin family